MTLRSIQLWMTIAVLVLAPLFFGSVDLFWVATWTILLSISALGGFSAPMNRRQSRLLLVFLALYVVYGLICFVQITPYVFQKLDDPIWLKAQDLLGIEASPRISSRANIRPRAVGHALLFAMAFMNGFCIGTSRRNSETLVRFAQYSILAYVIYGFVALVFTPDMLLWANKVAYPGSLTSTFVNHNTAATFVGVGAILWFVSTFSTAQSVRFTSMRTLLLSHSTETLALKFILRAVGTLICVFALLRTDSRGGLICSAIGLLVAMILMVANASHIRHWRILGVALIASVTTVVLISRIGRIGSEGLFDGGRWSVYTLIVQAIQERPFLGSGVGTFADAFPALRSFELNSWGVWDLAHSTVLEIAFEMGAPMAALVVIGAISSFLILARAAATSVGGDRRLLAAIAGIAALSYSHSLVDFSLQIPGYLIVFGILLGCGLANASSGQRKRRSVEAPLPIGPDVGEASTAGRYS